MDFKELEYVLAVAKFQNITKASQVLFISQPSLSKYIKNLENRLGVSLFNRLGNKFTLTYAGEIYIKNAKQILLIKNRMLNELQDISQFKKGEISIAFPYTRGSYMIPESIPKFKEKYPNINVNLIEDTSTNLEKFLLAGDVDIAVLNTPIASKDLDYIILGEEEILLISSINHPIAKNIKNKKRPSINLSTLQDTRFIMQHTSQRTGQLAEIIFEKTNFTPTETFYTRNIDSAVKLVAKNFGVCFIPEIHLKHLNIKKEIQSFSLSDTTIKYKLVIAFRKNFYLSKPLKDYIEFLKTSF
ncbi:MAG: LysR family transcriptional regulator [Sarcina sp.]